MTAAFDEEGRPLLGREYPADTAEAGNFSSGEKLSALLFMLEDLERSRQQIEHVNQEWIASMDAIADPVFLHDREFRILRCNRAYQQRAGMPFKQIIGRPYYEVFPKSHEPMSSCLRAMEKAETEAEEEVVVGETTYRSRSFSVHDEQGIHLYSVHILEDITESVRLKKTLSENEEKFRIIFEGVLDGILLANTETRRFIIGNPAICQMLGYSSKEIMRLGVADIHPEEALPHVMEQFERLSRGEAQFVAEIPLKRKDGSVFYADIKSSRVNFGGNICLLGVFRDITERKQAEIALDHANRALAALSAVNRNLVRVDDEDELLQSICEAIIEQRGYRLAWVGYKQDDASKSVRIMAHAGHDEGYLDTMRLTWAETERGMGSSGRAIRSGVTQLCQDIAGDPLYLPWREAALKHGYAANIALPLVDGNANKVFGILNVYATEVNAFAPKEIDLLEEMAGDLAFGVLTLHTRRERDLAQERIRQQLAQLQSNLEDTVRAMAAIVEMRDPYTAGHQARVADLSAAIARQMGLPEEQVHGIHLAGTIHDLGKIQVPAEILSKPGRLSATEFNLIKDHPQNGYEILRDIDFPWLIAQMVWQHHERLDGSGYPNGLKGEEILIEARILAVADTVEAMASHRPYRPGLGVEAALGEITRQRGIHYDPQVVDACLVLFREQGYSFKT